MEKIKYYQNLLQQEFTKIFYNYTPNLTHLYDPIYYSLDSGKKIRAASVLLAADVFGEINRNAIVCAVAAETFHNFTLLHDDVMDKSLLRRGKPTVQAKWGVNQAILTGDAMLILVYQRLLELSPDIYFEVLKMVNKTALEVCEGQQLDMDFENMDIVTNEQYNLMIKLKTAVLLAASLAIGAIVTKTKGNNIDNIYQYGLNLGLAFQIQDDYFDAFGDVDVFGKKIGNDIITNKKTFLYTSMLDKANDSDKQKFIELYNNCNLPDQEKINKVIAMFKKYQIDVFAKEVTNNYYQKSLYYLEKIETTEPKKQYLYEFADMILNRKK